MSDSPKPDDLNIKHYRVPIRHQPIDLADWPTRENSSFDKEVGHEMLKRMTERLNDLQELLFAEHRRSLLVVMQAMDAGGKDSTIRKVFGPLNPQGVRVSNFKGPTSTELTHDYLWRIHAECPGHGMIGVFNRSHYEDVLIARVKNLVPKTRWKKRFDHINAFEKMLADEGTHIVKFFLHISNDYQKRRLQRRLDRPNKHWKFDPADLEERKRWDAYQQAYGEAIGRCAAKHAPWYVLPAERKWYRCLLMAKVLVDTLEGLAMKYPKPTFDADEIEII